jgi:hypothetical protein
VSDDPLDDDWSEDIKKTLLAHRLWSKAPYDGVMGELPKGIPGNFQLEFQAIRNRLLETYTHEELLDYISDAQRMFDPDEDYVRPCIPLKIIRDVTTLMRLQEAVRLGKKVNPEAGLAFLTDSDLAKQITMGVKQYQNLAKGNLAASKNKTERANKYHDLWKKCAKETWEAHPNWEVTRVADHVLKIANDKNHKMANGNAYKVGTIIKVITGVKQSLKTKD